AARESCHVSLPVIYALILDQFLAFSVIGKLSIEDWSSVMHFIERQPADLEQRAQDELMLSFLGRLMFIRVRVWLDTLLSSFLSSTTIRIEPDTGIKKRPLIRGRQCLTTAS